MKAEFTPNYHTITVVMTDVPSTRPVPLGQEGDKLTRHRPQMHPAWTGGSQQMPRRAAGLAV